AATYRFTLREAVSSTIGYRTSWAQYKTNPYRKVKPIGQTKSMTLPVWRFRLSGRLVRQHLAPGRNDAGCA
ncbi:MAG: hypothetical protein OXF88_13805, partial [Rhodobacteraceae bacterium]|nr:hypothetical protein [Paracoccaceae bacterium]